MHRVSVIIPTYNRAHLVRRAIESVLAQTFGEFEVVVVDDGSTDISAQVVNSISDERLIYVYQANTGSAIARNNGVATSTGEYLVFLDSDDELFPDCLNAGIKRLSGRPTIGFAAGGCNLIDRFGRRLAEVCPWREGIEFTPETCVVGFPAIPSQWILRREWFERVGGFDPDFSKYNAGDDSDLGVRLCLAGCRMEWIEQITCQVRIHDGNARHNIENMRKAALLLMSKTWSNPHLDTTLLPLRNKAEAYMYLCAAARDYSGGLMQQAMADLTEAVRLDEGLLCGTSPRAIAELEGFATTLAWPQQIAYMRQVFRNLPSSAYGLRSLRGRSLSRISMRMAYLAHSWKESRLTRSALFRSLWYDPSWLRNRGVRSILVQSLLGQRAQSVLRRLRLTQGSQP